MITQTCIKGKTFKPNIWLHIFLNPLIVILFVNNVKSNGIDKILPTFVIIISLKFVLVVGGLCFSIETQVQISCVPLRVNIILGLARLSVGIPSHPVYSPAVCYAIEFCSSIMVAQQCQVAVMCCKTH